MARTCSGPKNTDTVSPVLQKKFFFLLPDFSRWRGIYLSRKGLWGKMMGKCLTEVSVSILLLIFFAEKMYFYIPYFRIYFSHITCFKLWKWHDFFHHRCLLLQSTAISRWIIFAEIMRSEIIKKVPYSDKKYAILQICILISQWTWICP